MIVEKAIRGAFVLLKNIKDHFPQTKHFRVLGTLERLFQLRTFDVNADTLEKRSFLSEIQEKLGNFLNNELLLGVLEYKGSFLLLNFEVIEKELEVAVGKRYFFVGEIVECNGILMLIPSIYSLCGDELDLFIYEKTIELLQTSVD